MPHRKKKKYKEEKKMKKTSEFKKWDEIAIALRELAEIDCAMTAAELSMNKAIDEIKASYESKVSERVERKRWLEDNVKLFVCERQNEFEDKKSKEFTFGKVGFRKSTEIVTRNVKAIMEALKRHAMSDCIITSEKIDKEALAKYDDEALLRVGARRKTGEKYYYEVNKEKII